ncbi:hypothetical protein [Winogradskya humida]|uniref:Tetratricopeptide repeat protein n=1 Tax=Winogradskya humida TaxID=113566 RepID=A0ABQ3ZFV2_9ACTN|nr:hypothetical protein [Actinoplanes humidus]GIE17447.1 hypothetical protein Ahu01nite_005490 [Actinoplanes humidus]
MLSRGMPAAVKETMGRAYTAFEAEDWPLAGELLATAAPSLTGETAAATWFDAALAYKFARDWPRAYEMGKIAVTHVRRGARGGVGAAALPGARPGDQCAVRPVPPLR